MPKGELYIKTLKIQQSDVTTGIVTDGIYDGYADAYVRYGLSLSDGAVDNLEAAAPHKSPIGTKSAVSHGVAYNWRTVGKVDERTVSIDVNITSRNREEYLERWQLFRDEVLHKDCGVILMRTNRYPSVLYLLLYQTHEQFRQWAYGGLAMFTLVFLEPHPELQTETPCVVMTPHTTGIIRDRVTVATQQTYSAVANIGSIAWESSDTSKATLSAVTGTTVVCSYIATGNVTITANLLIGGVIAASDRRHLTISRGDFAGDIQ